MTRKQDLYQLLQTLGEQEQMALRTDFLAPCLKQGSIRTRIQNLMMTFQAQPDDFEGWGIFRPLNSTQATLIEEASFFQVSEYLQLLKPMRWRLVHSVTSVSWLAYPVNESEAQTRWGQVKPTLIHLVSNTDPFEPIIGRWDGSTWWFEDLDRQADPIITDYLRDQFKQLIPPQALQYRGLTPEMRTTYALACQRHQAFQQHQQQQQDQNRVQAALKLGGGDLETLRDRGHFWQVDWRTSDGMSHTSAISKQDLTVIGAGICLSGRDRDFDLQSLVGVVENG